MRKLGVASVVEVGMWAMFAFRNAARRAYVGIWRFSTESAIKPPRTYAKVRRFGVRGPPAQPYRDGE
jgi:hypothetical protein